MRHSSICVFVNSFYQPYARLSVFLSVTVRISFCLLVHSSLCKSSGWGKYEKRIINFSSSVYSFILVSMHVYFVYLSYLSYFVSHLSYFVYLGICQLVQLTYSLTACLSVCLLVSCECFTALKM